MISREILKKVRQIEIRSNCLAKISTPRFQFVRVTACVKDRQNHDALLFDEKVNHEWKSSNNGAANSSPHFGKPFGIVRYALKVFLDGSAKFLPQAFALAIIPGNGFVKLLCGNATKDKAAFHLRYFASSFALTSSHETTSSGLSRWSWRRRSISSASPDVSSFDSTMSSQRLRHSSIRSTSGSARASLKTISELMATIYRSISLAQAAFFARANSSLVILPQLLSTPFQSDSPLSFHSALRVPRFAFV